MSPNHPAVRAKMARDKASAGEPVRDYYRNQGANRVIDQIIEAFNQDAVLVTSVPVAFMQRFVQIVNDQRP